MAKDSPKAKVKRERPLNPRERLFCHLYVANQHNGTQAALEAGFGTTEGSAASLASRLLRKVKVAAYLAKLEGKLLAKVDSRAETVLKELHHVGLARLSRTLNDDLSIRPVSEWGEDEKAALSDVDVEELFEGKGDEREHVGTLRKLKMRGKQDALHLLAKHHELVDADKLEVTGNITIVVADPYAAPSAAPPARRVDEMAG